MVCSGRPRGGKVLLAEDEFLASLALEEMLRSADLQVVGPAAEVADALLLAQSHGLAAAVLDVNLSGDQSWPVARLLRERGVPFFFLSGYLENHMRLPDDLVGTCMLAKPVEEAQFRAALDALLPRRPHLRLV